MPTIAHIINPVKVQQSSDLYFAQAITFESMRRAKKFAGNDDSIEIWTTNYPEDDEIVPDYFKKCTHLNQSVLDLNDQLGKRKLPLIKDIVQKLYDSSDAEYLIYTNADIGLMPHFYEAVVAEINKGHDAIVINRRRVNASYTSVDELPQIYSDLGKSHPGFDCFVFHRSLVPKFILGEICVGIPFIGVAMVYNVFCLAENPKFIPDGHLTFHIGEDVLPNRKNPFYIHNRKQFEEVVFPALKGKFDISKFPYGALPLYERAMKWMLNPSLFTKDFLASEQSSLKKKLDEIRWRILQK